VIPSSDQDIEVMMCRCKDMAIKSQSRKDLVFPIGVNFEGKIYCPPYYGGGEN
jgi:hypothetical protein